MRLALSLSDRRQSFSILRPIALGWLSVLILALSQSCSPASDHTLVIPLVAAGHQVPEYVRCIDTAVIDSSRMALVWVDGLRSGHRVWAAVVNRTATGRFEVASPPALIDSGRVRDAHVFADGDSYGVIYTKQNQLICRRPWNGPPVQPFAPAQPYALSSSALVSADSTLYIVALTVQSIVLETQYRWVAIAIAKDALQTHHLGTLRMQRVRDQPAPQLSLVDDSVAVAIYANWGSYVPTGAPGDSVGRSDGSAGAMVLLRLHQDSGDSLAARTLLTRTLPEGEDLQLARDFAVLEPSGSLIAAHAGSVLLVAPSHPSERVRRMPSSSGGSNTARPQMQALALKDGSSLLLWLDASRGRSERASGQGEDPSEFGAEIAAARITKELAIQTQVDGFPIRTIAQCLSLRTMSGQPVLAWARASSNWKEKARHPDGICVRMLAAVR